MREHRRREREMFVPLHHRPATPRPISARRCGDRGVSRRRFLRPRLCRTATPATSDPIRRPPPRPGWTATFTPSPFLLRAAIALYDNDRCLVSRILARRDTEAGAAVQRVLVTLPDPRSHGRPGKGNDKGSVEGWWAGRGATSWFRCRALRPGRFQRLTGSNAASVTRTSCADHGETIGQRLQRDLEAMAELRRALRRLRSGDRAVSSQALVRYKTNDYFRACRLWPPGRLVSRLCRPSGDRLRRRDHRPPPSLLRPGDMVLTLSITCPCWRRRSEPLDQARRWPVGPSEQSSRPCAG